VTIAGMGSGGATLCARQVHAHYLVPRDHPAPALVKARLDETIERKLRDALVGTFSPVMTADDASVWVIRQLELACTVNLGWDDDRVAQQYAARLTERVLASLRSGADGDNVIWFPDRAAYLASFLTDVARGGADDWRYRQFAGLRLLPVSAAIRTALAEQPEVGLSALLHLAPDELAVVLSSVSALDARRVLHALSSSSHDHDVAAAANAAANAWDDARLSEPLRARESENTLRLYLAVCRADRARSGAALGAATYALVRFAIFLSDQTAKEIVSIRDALATRTASPIRRLTAGDAALLAPLLRDAPQAAAQVATRMLSRRAKQRASPSPSPSGQRTTLAGGMFLLLPVIDALPIDVATAGWPDPDGTPAAALVRLLLLMKCCGAERAMALFDDPLARDLCGVSPAVSAAAVQAWARAVPTAKLAALLVTVAAFQRRSGAGLGRTLAIARGRTHRRQVAVLIDVDRGMWVAARPCPSPRTPRFDRWIPNDAGLAREPLPPDTKGRAAADKVDESLAHLTLPRELGLPLSADLAVSVVAQNVMRSFAWRLPGFAASGLPHVQRNFLDCRATIEEEPTRRIVRMGRPPLALILNITGMLRATYRISWLDARPFVLFPED
jgi:hypothetical protein